MESQKRDKESEFDRVTIEKRSMYNNRSQKLESMDIKTGGNQTSAKLLKMMEAIPEYDKG